MKNGVKELMNTVKVMTATATLAAGLVAGTQVHADDVVTTDTLTDKTATPTGGDVAKTVEVTANDVATAKAQADSAQADVKAQEAVATQTQDAVNQAQTAVGTAQADVVEKGKVTAEATPEAIQSAKDALAQAEDAKTKAEADVTTAQELVANDETAVANQAKTVETAKEAVNQATDKAEEAKAQVEADTKAVSDAEANLNKAKEADQKRQQDMAEAEKDVATKQATLTSTQNSVSQLQQTATSAQEALEKAQADYQTAENAYNSINTITMSSAYAEALKKAHNYDLSKEEQEEAEEFLGKTASQESSKNIFKHNDNDKNRLFNIKNITSEQAKELSLFAADLINQARKSVGAPLVEVTADSINESKNQATYYASKGMTLFGLDHDMSVLDGKYYDVDEDLAAFGINSDLSNMDDAKYFVYQAVTGWIFNDGEWLHARSVLGLRKFTKGTSFVGVGLLPSIVSEEYKDEKAVIVNLNIFNLTARNSPTSKVAGCKGFGLVQGLAPCA